MTKANSHQQLGKLVLDQIKLTRTLMYYNVYVRFFINLASIYEAKNSEYGTYLIIFQSFQQFKLNE